MSIEQNIIPERAVELLPGVRVGRILPFRKKRMVSAFCFIDHSGPAEVDMSKFGVGQHPHIGISTLSWLYEGKMYHIDSLGSKQLLEPGGVNYMTAGKGIVHGEGSDPNDNPGPQRMHAFQIWVALPKELEDIDPSFHHFPAEEIPQWTEEGVEYKLVAGQCMDHESPVPVHWPCYMLDVHFPNGGKFSPADQLYGEFGVFAVSGEFKTEENDTMIGTGQMLVADSIDLCCLEVTPDTRLLIFGGKPLPEERFYDWNFVSTDKAKLEKAKNDWINGKFKMIEGDDSYIPYPTRKKM